MTFMHLFLLSHTFKQLIFKGRRLNFGINLLLRKERVFLFDF